MIGGLIVCIVAITNMTYLVNKIIHPVNVTNITFAQPSNEEISLAYSGTAVAILFYVIFLCYCMYGVMTFCKAPPVFRRYSYAPGQMLLVSIIILFSIENCYR